MRIVSLLAALLVCRAAHADALLAGDPPAPPPPPPPPVIVAVAPPPVVAYQESPRPRPPLSDRWTLTPAFGGMWMSVHGVVGSGLMLQPTVTRTFDRFELSADYAVARLGDASEPMPTTVVHRLGASAHYQAGRIRVGSMMTLDLLAQAGVGIEHLVRDRAGSIDRPDLSLGLGFRVLDNLGASRPHRILFGLEMGARLLVIPRASGGADLGCGIAFGVLLGR